MPYCQSTELSYEASELSLKTRDLTPAIKATNRCEQRPISSSYHHIVSLTQSGRDFFIYMHQCGQFAFIQTDNFFSVHDQYHFTSMLVVPYVSRF